MTAPSGPGGKPEPPISLPGAGPTGNMPSALRPDPPAAKGPDVADASVAGASLVFGRNAPPDPPIRRAAPFVIALLAGILALLMTGGGAAPSAEATPGIGNTLRTVFLSPPPEARLVIVLLVAFAAASLAQLTGDGLSVGDERRRLETCRAACRKNPRSEVLIAELHKQLRTCSTSDILVRAVQSVYDLREMDAPDLEAVSGSLVGLESARLTLGRGVGNRLMLLSLLGTVVGLSRVIGTLQPQLRAAGAPGAATGDVENILTNLQGTLTQMGTAFSSTAWGILLASLVATVAAQINERRARYLAEVQFFAVSELAPRLLPRAFPNVAVRMREFMEESQATYRTYTQESERAMSALQQAGRRHLLELQGAFETHQATFEQHQKDVSASLADTLIAMRQELTTAIAQVARTVTALETASQKTTEEIHDALASAGDYVVKGAQAQIEVAQQLDKLLAASAASLEGAAETLQDSVRPLSAAAAAVARLESASTSLGTNVQTLVDAQAAIHDQFLQEARTLHQEMERRTRLLIDESERILKAAEPNLPPPEVWTRLQTTLAQSTAVSGVFARALQQGGQQATLAANEMSELRAALETFNARLGILEKTLTVLLDILQSTPPDPTLPSTPNDPNDPMIPMTQ